MKADKSSITQSQRGEATEEEEKPEAATGVVKQPTMLTGFTLHFLSPLIPSNNEDI